MTFRRRIARLERARVPPDGGGGMVIYAAIDPVPADGFVIGDARLLREPAESDEQFEARLRAAVVEAGVQLVIVRGGLPDVAWDDDPMPSEASRAVH